METLNKMKKLLALFLLVLINPSVFCREPQVELSSGSFELGWWWNPYLGLNNETWEIYRDEDPYPDEILFRPSLENPNFLSNPGDILTFRLGLAPAFDMGLRLSPLFTATFLSREGRFILYGSVFANYLFVQEDGYRAGLGAELEVSPLLYSHHPQFLGDGLTHLKFSWNQEWPVLRWAEADELSLYGDLKAMTTFVSGWYGARNYTVEGLVDAPPEVLATIRPIYTPALTFTGTLGAQIKLGAFWLSTGYNIPFTRWYWGGFTWEPEWLISQGARYLNFLNFEVDWRWRP